MPYTQFSLATLTDEIALAMQDPTSVFWKREEIYALIREGMYLWGAGTSYWRERGQFSTVAGTYLYDLSAQLPNLRARTVTLDDLVKQIQYHLDEAAAGVSGAGMTTQFTVNQIIQALILKRNEFVIDARLPFALATLPITPSPEGRTDLTNDVVAIGNLAWVDSQGVKTPLRREDAWSEDGYMPLWPLEPGVPFAYSEAETKPIQLQLYPGPLDTGNLELLYVPTIQMAGLADTETFQIPDEFSGAIKWGALYSILSSHNEGFDPQRAQYALERYKQYVTTAALHRSILRTQVGRVPAQLDTLANIDGGMPTWRNSRGVPTLSATLYDFVALAKAPDNVYGITCDVVRSAPVPANIADPIQMGPEEIPYLMDFVRHSLSFKLGGSEFTATMPLFDNFLSAMTQRNKLLGVQARYLTPLFGQAAIQEDVVNAA